NLLTEKSKELKEQLIKNGAKFILSYFDENSLDDSRWFSGHENVRKQYGNLLENLLKDNSLGLILKPKAASTLFYRLGPVAEILQKALNTGRCFLFQSEGIQYPPAIAALASDLAIHSHVTAVTAALEASLSGTPTVMFDCDKIYKSRFYSNGENKLVFSSMDEFWCILDKHRKSKNGIKGLGDWSKLIEEIDPFRDGLAANRMGTYLKWLIEDLDRGVKRDEAMYNAKSLYEKKWGKDKILSLN
ncbi:MAG: hypothetical protein KDK36_14150, partial [Leptospiraceae bacterium]|nr:hypothetical protein [Leptospiraceae bacterium]